MSSVSERLGSMSGSNLSDVHSLESTGVKQTHYLCSQADPIVAT